VIPTPQSAPILPIGKIKTFGELGPYYQITGSVRQTEDGEWIVPVRVVESGEEFDYRYSRLMRDPDAF
jgi:hypothetical protein